MKGCLLGLVCLFVSIYSFGQTLESDRLALVAIYNKANGPNWGSNWVVPGNVGDSPCGWDGVICTGGRVTRLTLSVSSPMAPLPPEIGNLSELTYLDLWTENLGPGFMGVIPSQLGNLSKLEYLRLDGNYFDLQDVSVIGNLTSLKELSMNPLGDIPASFANLVNLERCTIGQSGHFPVGVWELAFPDAIYQWPKIKVLRLAGLSFLTPMSSQIGNLTTLDTLEVTGTSPYAPGTSIISWSIPAEMGNLINLRYLNLSDNGLTGTIPASFNNLTKLTTLNLSRNELTGPIPNILGIPVSADVRINDNAFNFSGMETNISRLDAYGNQKKFKMYVIVPLGGGGGGFLYAENAGGALANNTYKWYQDGILYETTLGSDYLSVPNGVYRVEVTNSLVPGLTLVSDDEAVSSMPVTLVSFEGRSENNLTKLVWKTTSETNNKGFEIERSADARTFEKVGFVDGSGDSKEINTYHFTDINPSVMSYYRLKQLDYDGKFEYSKVIAVKSAAAIVKVYPNPAQDYLTISGISEKQSFSIVDGNGRVVIEGVVTDRRQINIRNLGPGRYVVRVGEESSKLLINR